MIAYAAPNADGWGRAGELHYLEVIKGGEASAPETQALPMVIMLHGLGDQPSRHWLANFTFDRPVRMIMPRAPQPYETGFSWFDFGRMQQQPLARNISHAAALLGDLLEVLPQRRPTLGLPIVAGFSQGGMLSFALALRYPERLRMAVPIAGFLPDALWPTTKPKPNQPPVRALHGTLDSIVPFDSARDLTEDMRELGYDVALFEYPGVDHEISPAMQQRIHGLLHEAMPR